MIPYISNWSYRPTIIITFLCTCLCFGIGLLFEKKRRKMFLQDRLSQSTKQKVWTSFLAEIIIFTVCILSAVTFTEGVTLCYQAKQHGMYQHAMTWEEIQNHLQTSPKEDILPKNLQNSLVIYYKFGCEDCEAIYKDLNTLLKEKPNVYWVSTRSKQGIELRKTYPVSKVPSGMYITNRNAAIIKPLYQTKENHAILHQENLTILLNLYESNLEK